jgi:hypothetical protein
VCDLQLRCPAPSSETKQAMEVGLSPTPQTSTPPPQPWLFEEPLLQPSSYYARALRRIDQVLVEHRQAVEDLIGQKRASRFFGCGTRLWFLQDHETGKLRLHAGWFCGFSFCPLCCHRRRLTVQRRMGVATEVLLQARPGYRFIEVMFTVKNCPFGDLHRVVLALNQGFSRMTKLPTWPGLARSGPRT